MVHQICHEFRAMDDIVVDAPESAAPSVGAAAPSGGAAASAPAGAGDTAESAELARRMDELRASPAAVALRELDASVRLCPGDAYFYDEALGQVVVQRKATFVAYGLARGAAAPPPRGVLVGATACRYAVSSLDGSLLAVQVSETLVLVAEADGPRRWRVEVRGGAPGVGAFLERLAGGGGGGGDGAPRVVPGGVLWSDHGGTSQDLIVVTTRGADLYKVSSARGQCKLVRTLNHATRCFRYAPDHRLLVLATGPDGSELRCYFLRRDVGDLPRFELPPPERVPPLALAGYGAGGPALDPRDLLLAAAYGEPLLLHRRPGARALDVFAVRRDGCARLRTLEPGFPGPYAASATDDLLLVHGAKARATAVFDVRGPRGPAAVDVGGAVHGLRLLPPDLARDAARGTRLQPARMRAASFFAVWKELAESTRSVQKSAETTSM